LEKTFIVSERRACQAVGLNRKTKRRQPYGKEARALTTRISELSEKYPRFGYRKIFDKLKEEGWHIGREHVRLIRKRQGFQVIRKGRKRRLLGSDPGELGKANYPHDIWSYDLVMDQTADGRRLKFLTIIDEYTRYGLAIFVSRSITAGHVRSVLTDLFGQWGLPTHIKSDNGPEFIAQDIQRWLKETGVKTHFIEPGSPWQNGHNESFNAVFRDGCLNRWLFYSVQEARRVTESWLNEYNHERPHGSLGGKTPAAFMHSQQVSREEAA
jgi:putative transposase